MGTRPASWRAVNTRTQSLRRELSGGGSAPITIQYKQYGVLLAFLPTITNRGTIRLQVAPEVSALDYGNAVNIGGATVPALTIRRVKTEVELADGQSFVIGGLLDNRESDNFQKIPFLGDIPILGRFFQSMQRLKTNTELIVIVTPEIVNPIDASTPVPELKYPEGFLPPNSLIPMHTPDTKAAGTAPPPPPATIPVEKLIESQKPEIPLVVEGGMGVGGGGGGSSAATQACTSVTREEMRLSLNDRTSPNVSPSAEPSLGLTFLSPASSFDVRFNGAGLERHIASSASKPGFDSRHSRRAMEQLMKPPDRSSHRLRQSHPESNKTGVGAERLHVINVTRKTTLASSAEVAKSGGKRSKGLLGRDCLTPGEGMWIVPCEAIHTFFMRFAIDLVYLDRKNRIKKVASGVRPWRLSACLSAHSVLELPSGTVQNSQSRPGDFVEFSPASSSTDSPIG